MAVCLFIVGWLGVGLGRWVVVFFLCSFMCLFVFVLFFFACFLFVFCLFFVCLLIFLDISSRCLSLQDSNMSGVNGGHPRVVPGKV